MNNEMPLVNTEWGRYPSFYLSTYVICCEHHVLHWRLELSSEYWQVVWLHLCLTYMSNVFAWLLCPPPSIQSRQIEKQDCTLCVFWRIIHVFFQFIIQQDRYNAINTWCDGGTNDQWITNLQMMMHIYVNFSIVKGDSKQSFNLQTPLFSENYQCFRLEV